MKTESGFPVIYSVLIIALVFMAVHYFWSPFPDWAVRAIGIVMIADMAWLGYSLGRRRLEKREKEEHQEQNGTEE